MVRRSASTEQPAARSVATVARVRAGFAAALAIGPQLACASAPPVERSVLEGSPARDVLLLPFNVAVVMPQELEVLSATVWEELETYLRAEDRRLRTVSFQDARRVWLRSIGQVRAGGAGPRVAYDDVSRALVLELARHAEFDTVIAPSLFVREARITGRTAAWDGVERPVEIEAAGVAARRFLAETPLEGVAPAASLHAVVLDAEGNKLQEGLGGLELLVRVRVEADRRGGAQLRFETRGDLVADREHLRDGIARALSPFLPPSETD
jgi:hypothetical protein